MLNLPLGALVGFDWLPGASRDATGLTAGSSVGSPVGAGLEDEEDGVELAERNPSSSSEVLETLWKLSLATFVLSSIVSEAMIHPSGISLRDRKTRTKMAAKPS